jgi:LemA protein
MGGTLLLVILAVVVAVWLIGAYNGLIAAKNDTVNAWKQIDVQLKRRHDLIPNLVSTVKGSMEFEKETLQAVIDARSRAMAGGASGSGAGGIPAGVHERAAAETALTGALGKLFVVMEQYPDLKSSQNVRDLQEELSSTENKIAFARQLYNDVATKYNTKQQQFPTNLVAGMARATPAELWEIEDAAERAVPKVDLSLRAKP